MTDIDGVWTDGSMYYSEKGDEMKKFHTYDSAGVILCKKCGIDVSIITGEASKSVIRRSEKLKINDVFIGVKDKLSVAEEICRVKGISMNETAFIGDDLNDYQLLKNVGLSACPVQSPSYIKEIVDWVLPIKGGDGAFRFFVEKILEENGELKNSIIKAVGDFNNQ